MNPDPQQPPPEDTDGIEPDATEALLQDCLLRPEDEWQAAIEELCAAHPDKAATIRDRYALLVEVGFEAAEAPAGLGERFGDYRLLEKIGHGGMGVVYLAEQISMPRRVALKLIRRDYLGMPKARARFQREVEALSGLEHPGLCTIFEADEVDGVPFLAMQFLQGETLASRLSRWRRNERPPASRDEVFAVLELVEKIARALHAAHEAGVIHRDIKPGNIMVKEDGEPVILDFGLARPESSEAESLTLTSDSLGTPAYMPPEQISPKDRVLDRRSDLYSLAVTLFECLTLRTPFAGSTREELYRQVLTGSTPDVGRRNRRLPAELRLVLQKAMERDPEDRYDTALEFAEDLRRIREFEPVAVRAPSVRMRVWRYAQRQPVRAALAAVLVLGVPVVTGLVGYVFAKSDLIEAAEQTARLEAIDRQLTAGYFDLLDQRNDAAAEHFRQVLRDHEDNLEARQGLRISGGERVEFEVTGQHPAVAQFLAAMWHSPPGAMDPVALAKAQKFLRRGVYLSQRPRLLFFAQLGRVARALGDRDTVGDCAIAIEAHWPDDREARLKAAWLWSAVKPEHSIRICEAELQAGAGSGELDRILGRARAELGDGVGAAAAYGDALRKNGRDRVAIRLLAGVLVDQRRFAELLELMRDAASTYPESLEFQARLADAMSRVGRRDEARSAFARVATMTPETTSDRRYLATALRVVGRLEEAAAALAECIRRNPRSAVAWLGCAKVERARGDLAAAREALQRALDFAKGQLLAQSHYRLAGVAKELGYVQEVEPHYRQAIATDPRFAEAFCDLGLHLLRHARCREAVSLIERGHELGRAQEAWSHPSAQWLEAARQLAAREVRFVAMLESGEFPKDSKERLALASFALENDRPEVALSIYREALPRAKAGEARIRLLREGAYAAARLGFGAAEAARSLVPATRAELRRQARVWLRSVLRGLEKMRDNPAPAARVARTRWANMLRSTPHLAPMRAEASWALLAESERAALAAFWRDVERLGSK